MPSDAELKDIVLQCVPGDDERASELRQNLFLELRRRMRKSTAEDLATRAWEAVRDDVVRIAPMKVDKLVVDLFQLFEQRLGQ